MTILDRIDSILELAPDEVARELRRELEMGNASYVGDPQQIQPTHDNLLLVLERRKIAAERADIEPHGFNYTIQQLKNISPTSELTVLHFQTVARIFSLFIDSAKDEVIGCVSVVLKDGLHSV